mmetsp:Transcript_12444/g.29376  ORF Transcript_12444/g.29376 Transcript_12444/m.29376 type:complete len:316 (+) Transcript_12444:53-1000(+)
MGSSSKKKKKRVGKDGRGNTIVPWALALALLCCIIGSLSVVTTQIYMATQLNRSIDKEDRLMFHKHSSAVKNFSLSLGKENSTTANEEDPTASAPISPGHRLKIQQIFQTMHEYAITVPSSRPNGEVITPDEKAVLVLMSHSRQRSRNTDMLLWAYSQMPGVLSKIIFVWNNPDEEPPELYDYGNVPIIMFLTKTNHMANRFLAPTHLATRKEAILLVDDDVFLTAGLIGAVLRKWVGCNKLCLVGLDPRYVDPAKRQWTWKGGPGSNLVITKTMMATNSLLSKYLKHDMLMKSVDVDFLGARRSAHRARRKKIT